MSADNHEAMSFVWRKNLLPAPLDKQRKKKKKKKKKKNDGSLQNPVQI